jgi:hypothetical protein
MRRGSGLQRQKTFHSAIHSAVIIGELSGWLAFCVLIIASLDVRIVAVFGSDQQSFPANTGVSAQKQ